MARINSDLQSLACMDVAVFFDQPAYDDYPFSREEYRNAYHDLGRLIQSRNGTLWIVRGQKTYIGQHSFDGGWQFHHNAFRRVDGKITMDRIYNKGHFQGDPDSNVINNPLLEELCTDKWKTFLEFPHLFPKTILADSRESAIRDIATWESSRIVAKPVHGEEGQGVLIGPSWEVLERIPTYPYLIQEFIDTSYGIPGIVESTHDFRMVTVGGQLVLCFIRTPPQGGLLANVAQGGSIVPVLFAAIPKEALEIHVEVEKSLRQFPQRVYSIDLGLDSSGQWRIIELNAKPALFGRERGPDFIRFHELLADLLVTP